MAPILSFAATYKHDAHNTTQYSTVVLSEVLAHHLHLVKQTDCIDYAM